MHVSETSVRRPIATAMAFLAIILLGVVSLSRLSVDLLPDLAYPKLTIWTTYPDVAPGEVEELVTRPIEEAVSTVPGIRKIRSVSREGLSLVTIEFLWGTQMDFASLSVREKLDQLRWLLPREVGRSTLIRLDPRNQPIMALAITGGDLLQLKGLARDVIKRRLEQINGVAQATVTGGLDREIQVEIDAQKLTALGLTIDRIAGALAAANYNLPGGTIKKGRYRYSLRTLGEFQSPQEIEQVVISQMADGAIIRLRDLARVVDGYSERQSITRFNGQESIGLLILKEAGANTVEVSKLIHQVLRQLAKEYPGLQLAVAYDQARFISSAIANVIQNIIYGGLLAFLVLFFFLHDFRSPVNIALSMPISIITTFILLYFANVSLNMMSLAGLALGVGMLVDNSIVVLENIIRHRETGKGRLAATVTGAREVAMPVTASTLTTIAVFLPVIYLYGVAGQLFRDQALTVTFSLLASLLVSLTLLPMLISRSLSWPQETAADTRELGSLADAGTPDAISSKKGLRQRLPFRWLIQLSTAIGQMIRVAIHDLIKIINFGQKRLGQLFLHLTKPLFTIFDVGFGRFTIAYDRALVWALEHSKRVLLGTGMMIVLAILLSPRLHRELMPQVDPGEFSLSVKMPAGTTLEATGSVVAELETWLLQQNEIEAAFSTIGLIQELGANTEAAELSQGKIQVRLRSQRQRSTGQVIADARTFVTRLGVGEITFETGASVLQQVLGTAEPPVAIKVQGEHLSQCRQIAQEIMAQIQDVPGLKDLHLSLDLGRPEIGIQIDREAAGRYGVSAQQVATFIAQMIKGEIATRYRDFDQKIDVLVRPAAAHRDELEDLVNAHMIVDHKLVPLRELIHITESRGPSQVQREDQVRQVVVFANIQGRSFDQVIRDLEQRLAQRAGAETARIVVGGEREEVQRSFRSLALALVLAVALIYMILAAQFESLLQPLIIMLDVPITISAAVLLFWITGLSVNVISFIGIIVLAGIAVNDSIIKVDFINQERRRGTPVPEAIIIAGQKRLRPILMTTLTTILGLAPMAIGFGEGAELQRPLAVAIIGGLFFSTAITLLLVPVFYSILVKRNI